MVTASSSQWPDMPSDVRRHLRGYLGDVRERVGKGVDGVILYGSLARGEYVVGRSNVNILLMCEKIAAPILERCGAVHRRWAKEGFIAPLLLSDGDLRRSVDLFPMEYGEIKDCHVLLEGRDPFLEIHIVEDALKLQCLQELAGNLFRLRQRCIEGYGKIDGMRVLLPLSITSLVPCLRALLKLLGHPSHGPSTAVIDHLATSLNIQGTIFQEVWKLKRGLISPGSQELPHFFDRYTIALEELMGRVRQCEREGRL